MHTLRKKEIIKVPERMIVYIGLVAYICVAAILLRTKTVSKKFYCFSVCLFMSIIACFRSPSVGMWDTETIYLPSFHVIATTPFLKVIQLPDTHYQAYGYVIYCKLIALFSTSDLFFIFMTTWPFYAAVGWFIYRYSKQPFISFLLVLALNYFTYSFSMVRGMLAMSFLIIALYCALKKKWWCFLASVLLATTFHATSLIFLIVPIINLIYWSLKKIIAVYIVLIVFLPFLPEVWSWMVRTVIGKIVPNYNYYGTAGGEFADALLVVYLMVVIIGISLYFKYRCKFHFYKHGKVRMNSKNSSILYCQNINMLVGMAVLASILIVLTIILSEMIRLAMIFSLGSIVLCGQGENSSEKLYINDILQLIGVIIFIGYFFLASLPNMNAIPYSFFIV